MAESTKRLTRKQFLYACVGLAGVGAAVACGDGDTDDDMGDGGTGALDCSSDPDLVIDGNHGHQLAIPAADVEAAETKVYTLSDVGHSHELTVDANLFEKLKVDGAVSVVAETANGHVHRVDITC